MFLWSELNVIKTKFILHWSVRGIRTELFFTTQHTNWPTLPLEKIMTWPAAPAASAVVQPCQTLGNLAPSKISTRSTIIFSQPLTLTDWLETDRLVCIFIVAVKRTRFQTVPPSPSSYLQFLTISLFTNRKDVIDLHYWAHLRPDFTQFQPRGSKKWCTTKTAPTSYYRT